MINNFFLVILFSGFLLLSGCGKSFDENELQTITLTFAPVKIKLPDSYMFVSPDAFIDTVRFSDLPEPFARRYLDELHLLQSKTDEVDIYLSHDLDLPAVIFFARMEYALIDESILRNSVKRIETVLANATRNKDIKTNRMEARIFERSESIIAKVKYRISGHEFTFYRTEYLISSRRTNETYFVTFENMHEEDLEFLIFEMLIDRPR